MTEQNLFYALFLNSLSRISFKQCGALFSFLKGDLKNIFSVSREDLSSIPHMNEYLLESILKAKKEPEQLKWVEEEMALIQKEKIQVMTYWDETYPKLLKEISDPPPLLYVKGQLPKTKLYVGVVGARRASEYGLSVTRKLCQELAHYDVTIVSGMALGVDGTAHEATLKMGGSTVGILGNGLCYVYPRQHRALYERMAWQGALISEFPLTMPSMPHHFPRRNRIISGLCQGVVIVEASLKSGSLITARLALDQGREVFSVPGRIGSKESEGTHALIQQGAKLVTQVSDVLEELDSNFVPNNLTQGIESCHSVSQDEEKILHCLKDEPTSFEELLSQSSVGSSTLSEVLLACELKGFVEKTKQHQYKKGEACPNL